MNGLSSLDFDRWKLALYKYREQLDLASLIWFWSYLDSTQKDLNELEKKYDLIIDLMGNELKSVNHDIYGYREVLMKFTPFSDYVKDNPVEVLGGSNYYSEDLTELITEPDLLFCNTVEFSDHPVLGNSKCTEVYVRLSDLIANFDGRISLPFELGDHSIITCCSGHSASELPSDDACQEKLMVSGKAESHESSLKDISKHDSLYAFYRCRLIREEYYQLKNLTHKDVKNNSNKFREITNGYSKQLISKFKSVAYLYLSMSAAKGGLSLQEFESSIIEAFEYIWFSEHAYEIYNMNIGEGSVKTDKIAKEFTISTQAARGLIRTVTPDLDLNIGSKGDDDKRAENITRNRGLIADFLADFYGYHVADK